MKTRPLAASRCVVAAPGADAAAAAVDPAAAAVHARAAPGSRADARAEPLPRGRGGARAGVRAAGRAADERRARRRARGRARRRDRRRRRRRRARRRSTARPTSAAPSARTGRTAPSATTSTASARRPARPRTQNDGDIDDSDRDTPTTSLQDHLRSQLSSMRLSDADAAAVLVLIESLDDDGYLADSLEDIAERLREGGLAIEPTPSARRRRSARPDPASCAAACASCRAWSRPASARATWPSA